ncbi:DUF1656 domain-containing protein [Edwardsiella piscicida]|uniref:DUF1656 domain-containing protein n=1 Tax=Edwardsiella piscicida TaxID=1263550 RepID=UPI00054CB3D8|nr:DUF1656 domain-containing protein [Edwardsiella piscicida]AOP43647.1 DUF1656 domain-containing protein [Edwardsiella piscicida]EKS7766626.1 DUF1656 domain-containing protein [Edwardsiella piscicida]ELM3657184.1 DUF1656 domain-containing protein [Edwardsiella piscicida]ELM3737234.1 DUF1656 domain-containing protein [Edwardsiella piscicida]QBB13334.1 DUF1656 domain-containing protein [Edwardsiella piscicida]
MELFNDVVLLNAFIPKLVVLGILCFIITQLSVKFAARYHLLRYFWHPRLIVWAYASAVYALLVIATLYI